VAALFGLMDLLAIPRGTKAFATGITHLLLNVCVLGAFVVNFIWRHDSYYETTKVRAGQLLLSAVAIAALAVSGWLGGRLAYRFGVRVAQESDQAAGYR
jgi:uncharacterized membrane protein